MCVKMGVLWSKIERVLSKEIQREQLKTWDHIYTWRPGNSKFHGIYDGDNEMVIHITPRHAGQENSQPCDVVSSSMDEFLDGGKLYRFEYGINIALFLAKPQGWATCTRKSDDKPEFVKKRASDLLVKGFRVHHRFKNNSEDFAVNCKTGLLSVRVSRSEQAASFMGCAVFFLGFPLFFISLLAPASLTAWVAIGVFVYCTCRMACDMEWNPYVRNRHGAVRVAQEEVKELSFLNNLAYWSFASFFSWFFLMCQVAVLIFYVGAGCCLLSSGWINYCVGITSTLVGAIPTPIKSREFHVCVKIAGVLWSKIQNVLSKKVQREKLKPGDHIYTWRPDNSKSHGIYDDDNEKVIHVTPRHAGQENSQPCGVVSSSIDDFLDGGKLYRFEYGVNPALFLAKPQGGATCTLITDTPEFVKRRASFFLDNGFPVPHLHKNNSEVFAVYCKTGLLSNRVSRSEQAASLLTCAILFLLLNRFTPASLTGWAATGVVVYCIYTLASDIGARADVMNKVSVEKLADVEVKELGFLPTLMDWVLLVFIIWFYLVCAVPECVMLYCGAIFQGNFKFRSWLLFDKISLDQLQPGDHIYKWKGYAYTHHGIYAGNEEVIHVVRDSGPLLHSLYPSNASNDHVESIKIDDFASGGELYRHDYGVKLGYFIAKIRGGACTLASSDPTTDVLHRANFLLRYKRVKYMKLVKFEKLEEGKGSFGTYNLFTNNCEDFAIYCKTGLLVPEINVDVARSGQTAYFWTGQIACPWSGQIACLLAAYYGFFINFTNPYLPSNLICAAAVYFCIYSTLKMITKTKNLWDTRKIPVEILADSEKLADFKESVRFNFKLVYLLILLKLVLLSTMALWTWWCPVSLFLGMGRYWRIGCGNQQLEWIAQSIAPLLPIV